MLRRAIGSVRAQTCPDWECIVVDDASSDETPEVVRQYGDPRIKYLRLSVNSGQCAARNHGIRAAQGSYIAFLDSDDEWLPEKLEAQVAAFDADATGQLGVVLCGLIKVAEPSGVELSRKIPNLGRHPLRDLLDLGDNPPTYTLMVRRECFAHELWDERLPHRTDWDLCVRLARTQAFHVVPRYLVRAFQHEGPRTSVPDNPWSGWEYCIDKYRADLQALPKSLSRHHYFAFRAYYAAGVTSGARRHLLRAVWYDPSHPGRWITLGALLMGRRATGRVVTAYETLKQLGHGGKPRTNADHGTLRAS